MGKGSRNRTTDRTAFDRNFDQAFTKKERYVFDLDGVMRDLTTYFLRKYEIPYPNEWFWTHKGKDFWWWAEHDGNKAPLLAPKTEYLDVIKARVKDIEIWTHQPDHWKDKTRAWIKLHVGKCDVHFLDTAQKRKRLDESQNTTLVEDCPNFTNYDHILLIDRPYNRHIMSDKVWTPAALERRLKYGWHQIR